MADTCNPTETEIGRESPRACWPANLVQLGSPRPQREMLSQNLTLRNDTWGWSLASTSMSTHVCTHTYTYTGSLPHTQYILHIHTWISHPYMSEVDECVYLSWERWRCKVSKDPNRLIEKGARNAQTHQVSACSLCVASHSLLHQQPALPTDTVVYTLPSSEQRPEDSSVPFQRVSSDWPHSPQGEPSRGTALKEHFLSVLCSSCLCPFRHGACTSPQSSARSVWFPTPRSHFCE